MDEALKLPVEADTAAFVANLARAAEALEKLANANDDASEKTEEHGEALKELQESIGKVADRTKDSIEVFTMWYERVLGAVEGVAKLSTEAERLARVQDDLGVSLQEAQDNAIGFANEADAATAAITLQERGIRVTQTELNALMRIGSSYARTTGKELSEVMENLAETVTEGGEELGKFDLGLLRVADGSHTAGQRLAAMVQRAREIEDASDTATDAVERFKDEVHDLGVEAASTFNSEFVRLASIAEDTRDAASATRDWTETVQGLGAAAAETLVRAGEGVGALAGIFGTGLGLIVDAVALAGTGLSELAAGNFRGVMDRLEEEFATRFERGEGFAGTAAEFARNRIAALERLSEQTNDRTSLDPGGFNADMTFTPDQVRGMNRDRRFRNRSNDQLTGQQQDGPKQIGRMVGNLFENPRQSLAAQLGFTGESPDSLAVMDEDAGTETNWIANNTGKSAAQRAVNEAAFGQSDEGRLRDRRRERQSDRERREQDLRLDQRESFLERWERLNQREIIANDVLAESMSMGFNVITTSFSDHLRTLLEGNEAGAQFWEKMAADTMAALGKEAFGKSAFYAAESLGFLVMGNLPQAGTAAAASVAYGVAGAALTYGAAEMGAFAPETKGASGGGSAGGGSPSRPRLSASGSDTGGQNTTTVVNHYYSPVIGGRESSNAEVGTRLGRYEDARDRRVRRDRS